MSDNRKWNYSCLALILQFSTFRRCRNHLPTYLWLKFENPEFIVGISSFNAICRSVLNIIFPVSAVISLFPFVGSYLKPFDDTFSSSPCSQTPRLSSETRNFNSVCHSFSAISISGFCRLFPVVGRWCSGLGTFVDLAVVGSPGFPQEFGRYLLHIRRYK